MNNQYLENIHRLLDQLAETQQSVIEAVSEVCANAIYHDRLLYFFGTGHSHMICEEPFYRAGGLACVYPILEPDLMLHSGASKSSAYERIQGLGNVVISQTPIQKGDVLFLISNSGRNAVIVDAAMEAHSLGATTIAVTSMNHTINVESPIPMANACLRCATMFLTTAARSAMRRYPWRGCHSGLHRLPPFLTLRWSIWSSSTRRKSC